MPRFVIISDTHNHAWPKSPVRDDGANKRLLDVLECWDKAVTENGAALIHGGDVFHDRKGVKPEVLDRTAACLQALVDRKTEMHFNVGNHDLSITGDGTTSARILQGVGAVYTTPTVAVIRGVRFGFMPYTDDAETVRAWTKTFRAEKVACVIAHHGIGDPRFADCVPTDYEAPGHINVDDMAPDHFQRIFIGHYHKPQVLRPNMQYIGAPLQQSFKDANQKRGIVVWDSDKDKVTFVENTFSPRFHKVSASDAVGALATAGKRDHVWVVGVTNADRETLREVAADRESPIRYEAAPPKAAAARLKATAPDNDIVAEYVRIVAPGGDHDDNRKLIAAGTALLHP